MMNKGVTKRPTTELSTDVTQFLSDAEGEGLGFSTKELQMPFLRLAQDLSPQVKSQRPEYIPELKVGQFFNSVTQEIFPDGVSVIPIKWEHRINEWRPRAQGGGYLGTYLVDAPDVPVAVRREKGLGITADGTELQEALQYLVLQVDDNDRPSGLAVLSFVSTQIKKAKRWNGTMASFKVDTGDKVIRPPIYACVYTITAVPESRNANDYWGFNISPPQLVQNVGLLRFAKEQYEQFKEAALSVDFGHRDGEEDEGLDRTRKVM